VGMLRGRGLICTEYFEGGYKTSFTLSVENHDTCDIPTSVTVIRCTPDRNEILIEMIFITFHDKLMCSCNQGEVIYMVKLQSGHVIIK
jgi:hypothetical protein